VPLGNKALCPFGAEKLLADKKSKNLPTEKLTQSRVVDAGDIMEEARSVHPALGHQEMEVRVKIKGQILGISPEVKVSACAQT
jgi:hypothetical protein